MSCTHTGRLPLPLASGNMSRLMSEGPGKISTVWLLAALIVGILIMGDLTRRMTDARRMERDARTLATEVSELETLNEDLEQNIAGAGDDASVEAWARSQAKMIQEGERLVVPQPVEEPSFVVAQPPEAPVEPPTTWEVWLALLGGG
jgi:cell division protein FtsB